MDENRRMLQWQVIGPVNQAVSGTMEYIYISLGLESTALRDNDVR